MQKYYSSRSFVDFIAIITKWKRLLIINLLIVGIVSLIISINLTKWFKSSSLIIPPTEQRSSGISSLLNNLPISALGIGGSSGNEATYMALLKSRTLIVDVIEKYNLQQFYEKPTLEETILAFWGDYNVQLTEENMISISYEYTDSVMVADIVNHIVKRLGEMSTKLMLAKAEVTKDYIEIRYLKNKREIDSLATTLEQFNSQYGIIEFEEQTKALIASAAQLETQLYLKQAELEALGKTHGFESPQYQNARIPVESLAAKLQQMKKGIPSEMDNPFTSLFLNFEDIPKIGKEYAELYTAYLMQTKLKEYLLPEYEQAKLQLLKDKPGMQVIDYATPPDKKSKPKRAVVVLASVFVALLLSVFYVLFIERLHWLKTNNKEKYYLLQSIFKSWKNPFSKSSIK